MTIEIIELSDKQKQLLAECVPHFNAIYDILNQCQATSPDVQYTSFKLKDALVWMNASITSSYKEPDPVVDAESAKPVEGEVVSAA